MAAGCSKTIHFEAKCTFTAVKPYILKPGGHRGGADMAIGVGLKVCNCQRKELQATGEVVTVAVEVEVEAVEVEEVTGGPDMDAILYNR